MRIHVYVREAHAGCLYRYTFRRQRFILRIDNSRFVKINKSDNILYLRGFTDSPLTVFQSLRNFTEISCVSGSWDALFRCPLCQGEGFRVFLSGIVSKRHSFWGGIVFGVLFVYFGVRRVWLHSL